MKLAYLFFVMMVNLAAGGYVTYALWQVGYHRASLPAGVVITLLVMMQVAARILYNTYKE